MPSDFSPLNSAVFLPSFSPLAGLGADAQEVVLPPRGPVLVQPQGARMPQGSTGRETRSQTPGGPSGGQSGSGCPPRTPNRVPLVCLHPFPWHSDRLELVHRRQIVHRVTAPEWLILPKKKKELYKVENNISNDFPMEWAGPLGKAGGQEDVDVRPGPWSPHRFRGVVLPRLCGRGISHPAGPRQTPRAGACPRVGAPWSAATTMLGLDDGLRVSRFI